MSLLLLAGALALGGWFVAAPSIATLPPSIERATPASGARAAGTAARASEALLPSSASRVASAARDAVDGARCGQDQVAVYETPRPDPADGMIHVEMPHADPDGVVRHFPGETRPAGVGYTGAMRRIDAALRASADPFDRATADWLDLDRIAPPAARADALVADALAVNDPRVYALAYSTCRSGFAFESADMHASASCARLSAARWAQLDPGNAAPWFWALGEAERTGDVAAVHAALANIASSSRFDGHPQAGAAAVARLRLADADLAAQTAALTQAMGLAQPPAAPLTMVCRPGAGGADAALASTCSRIAEVLYDHADSIIWHNLGGALHRLVTGDASWLDRAHQEQRSMASAEAAVEDRTPCGGQRDFLRTIVRMDAIGELNSMREGRHAASAP